jgi:GNAT superfamily N-acetyltransferase
MLVVRAAVIEDWPAILGMVKSYAALTALPGSLDVDATRDVVSRMIVGGTALVAYMEDEPAGVCLLEVGPHVFTKNLIAQEAMWWVEPKHRRNGVGAALLRFAEDLAHDRGAVGLLVHAFSFGTQDAAESAFTNMGYSRIQTGWFKGVD